MGWSVFGEVSNLNWPFVVSVFILYSSIGLLKDFGDYFGDRIYNVKTLPSVLGLTNARKWVIFSMVIAYCFVLLLTFLNNFKPTTYILIFFLLWVWHINSLLVKIEKVKEEEIVINMVFLGFFSVLSLIILNISI